MENYKKIVFKKKPKEAPIYMTPLERNQSRLLRINAQGSIRRASGVTLKIRDESVLEGREESVLLQAN